MKIDDVLGLFKTAKKSKVDPKQVSLEKAKGSPERGGGPGGFYWHILLDDVRVGNVFINMIEHEILGKHPSIQIHINQNQRGRGIGKTAYRLACEQSSYDKVFAHMRKSNVASQKAAESAGFVKVENDKIKQLSLVWNRKK